MDIVDEAAFCHRCGAPLGKERLEPTPRERLQEAISDKRPDSDPPEQQLWQGSFSKLAMIGWWIGAAVFTLALLVVAVVSRFDGRGWLISLAIIFLVWAGLVVRLLYLQLSRRYFLSNQRFVHVRSCQNPIRFSRHTQQGDFNLFII